MKLCKMRARLARAFREAEGIEWQGRKARSAGQKRGRKTTKLREDTRRSSVPSYAVLQMLGYWQKSDNAEEQTVQSGVGRRKNSIFSTSICCLQLWQTKKEQRCSISLLKIFARRINKVKCGEGKCQLDKRSFPVSPNYDFGIHEGLSWWKFAVVLIFFASAVKSQRHTRNTAGHLWSWLKTFGSAD